MTSDEFQEWWNKRYLHKDSRYHLFKKLSLLGADPRYIDRLLVVVQLRDKLDTLRDSAVFKTRLKEIAKQIRQNQSEIKSFSSWYPRLWKYGSSAVVLSL